MTQEYERGSKSEKEVSMDDWQERYQQVLETKISPKNCLDFYEQALDNLDTLTDEMISVYLSLHPEEMAMGAALEDKVFLAFGMNDIDVALAILMFKKTELDDIARYIQEQTLIDNHVFAAPKPGEYALRPGLQSQEIRPKKLIPRLISLLYILQHDLNISLRKGVHEADVNVDDRIAGVDGIRNERTQDVAISQGAVTRAMIRKEPYFVVKVHSLDRTVYVCDEEGNITFIFDSVKMQESDYDFNDIRKDQLMQIVADHPDWGTSISQSASWREQVLQALTESFGRLEKKGLETVLQSIQEKPDMMYEPRPEGWESASSLAVQGIGERKTIISFADSLRFSHPHWFKIYKPSHMLPCWHYDAQLVKLIKEEFGERKAYRESFEKKKPGWESAASLSVSGVADYDTILRFVAAYKKEHPEPIEWELQLAPRAKAPTEHYSPALLNVIKDEMQKRKSIMEKISEPPDGWLTLSALQKKLGCGSVKLQKLKLFVDDLKKEYPDEWGQFRYQKSKLAGFISPKLVEIIESKPEFTVIKRKQS